MKNINTILFITIFIIFTIILILLIHINSKGGKARLVGTHFVPFSTEKYETADKTDSIEWDAAKVLIEAHMTHPNPISIKVCTDDEDAIVPLHGFWVDADYIARILYGKNARLPDRVNDYIYLMPAVRPTTNGSKPPRAEQYFTIIIAGLDADKNIDTGFLIDFFDPCPSKCPENVHELFENDPRVTADNAKCDRYMVK